MGKAWKRSSSLMESNSNLMESNSKVIADTIGGMSDGVRVKHLPAFFHSFLCFTLKLRIFYFTDEDQIKQTDFINRNI